MRIHQRRSLQSARNGFTHKRHRRQCVEKIPINPAPPDSLIKSSGIAQSNRLAGQLRPVANMIATRDSLGVKRQIFFVALGGFDNHVDRFKNSNTPATPILSGANADLLKQLDQALTWFYNWAASQGIANNVTSFTMSDFGRTQTSNGAGSDHGWGTHCFALGGAVNGGAFYGGTAAGSEFPTVVLTGPNDAGQGRLLPVTSVDEFGATFARWMGASTAELGTVFPTAAALSAPAG